MVWVNFRRSRIQFNVLFLTDFNPEKKVCFSVCFECVKERERIEKGYAVICF